MISSLEPLYVDLDGTLIATDLLHESALRLARDAPPQALRLPGWVLGGDKAALKRRIAAHVAIDPAGLPYREEVVTWLREQKANGRRIVLATASDQKYADAVARHLGVFDAVLASDGKTNLKGATKLSAIEVDAKGAPFWYAGDHHADLAVWAKASGAVVVSPSPKLARRAADLTRVVQTFQPPRASLRDLLYGIRLHQWLKNLLVFVPVLPITQAATPAMWLALVIAFVAFGLAASSIYVLNDLLDLESDRQHHRKKHRPFASGRIGVPSALLLAGGLLAASVLISALLLSPVFLAVLGGYVALTTLYSVKLKRMVLVDVFTLAALYTLRILAGAAAIQVAPSFWILGFSVFTFLSLALAKRYVELAEMSKTEGKTNKARGYKVQDLAYVQAAGISSGQVSALVLSLYLNDPLMVKRYTHPYVLWLIMPLFLYWMTRIWLKAHRGELHDDPVVFAAKDKISRLVLLGCGLAVFGAL